MGFLSKLLYSGKSDRDQLIEQFDGVHKAVMDQMTKSQQVAALAGIILAQKVFISRFSEIKKFRSASQLDQNRFILQLNNTANMLSDEQGDNETALGFLLVKYWIAARAPEDQQLCELSRAGLNDIHREANS
jgi:hypothetical protein